MSNSEPLIETTAQSRVDPQPTCSPDWDKITWRQLEKGEEIKPGDWVDIARDGWRDDPKWRQTKSAGDIAPDPAYASHRNYRRVLEANAEASGCREDKPSN